MVHDKSPGDKDSDPGFAGVYRYLTYGLSIPERALRTTVVMVGGAVRESASLLVPQAFQNSRTYSAMIRQMLDYLVEDVGGVARPNRPAEARRVENFVARKAVGNFIEMASLATLHLSPLTVLAILGDVAYGSQTYLKELSAELKRQGIIDERSTIDDADDLLAAVAAAASTSAAALDTPPLSVDGLRETIEQTRQAVRSVDPTKIIPQAEIARLWAEIHQLSEREGVGIIELSGAITLESLAKLGTVARGALSTVKVASMLVDRHILDHYRHALADVRARGIAATLAENSAPYIDALWLNFASNRPTLTEDLVSGKLAERTWDSVRRWLGGV